MSQCYICHDDTDSLHNHHSVPQSAGGKDSPQIPLCANCHNSVHREINRLLVRYRRKKDVGGIKWGTPKHAGEISIASKIVFHGLKGVIDYELHEGKIFKIQVPLPVNIHAGLTKLKQQGGFNSLDTTIIECISLALRMKGIQF